MPNKPFVIGQPHQILAEGRDAELFCVYAAEKYELAGVQVHDFGGVADDRLVVMLQDIQRDDYFPHVKSITVARDAETSYVAALKSVQDRIRRAGLCVPSLPYDTTGSVPAVAVAIFAVRLTNDESPGTLEHMCLESVATDPIIGCVEAFLTCAGGRQSKLVRPHKARLHAYLAAKSGRAGLKLGEATRAGVWDLQHACFAPLKELFAALKAL